MLITGSSGNTVAVRSHGCNPYKPIPALIMSKCIDGFKIDPGVLSQCTIPGSKPASRKPEIASENRLHCS